MAGYATKIRVVSFGLMICLLSGCYHPPYNNFKPDPRMARGAATGVATGSVVGLITSGTLSGTLFGGAIGGTIGTVRAVYKDSKPALVKQLKNKVSNSLNTVIP